VTGGQYKVGWDGEEKKKRGASIGVRGPQGLGHWGIKESGPDACAANEAEKKKPQTNVASQGSWMVDGQEPGWRKNVSMGEARQGGGATNRGIGPEWADERPWEM